MVGQTCESRSALTIDGLWFFFFFFQAEDGIRDIGVTGVQTCALPICSPLTGVHLAVNGELDVAPIADGGWASIEREWHSGDRITITIPMGLRAVPVEIGRASCRERV